MDQRGSLEAGPADERCGDPAAPKLLHEQLRFDFVLGAFRIEVAGWRTEQPGESFEKRLRAGSRPSSEGFCHVMDGIVRPCGLIVLGERCGDLTYAPWPAGLWRVGIIWSPCQREQAVETCVGIVGGIFLGSGHPALPRSVLPQVVPRPTSDRPALSAVQSLLAPRRARWGALWGHLPVSVTGVCTSANAYAGAWGHTAGERTFGTRCRRCLNGVRAGECRGEGQAAVSCRACPSSPCRRVLAGGR